MTIIHQGPGAILLLDREELPSPALPREELLALLRGALSRSGHPLPPSLEIRMFQGRQGVLFLLLPALDARNEKNFCAFS